MESGKFLERKKMHLAENPHTTQPYLFPESFSVVWRGAAELKAPQT